jgi:hypothetical protein
MASDHKERHSLSVVAPMDLTTRAWCFVQLNSVVVAAKQFGRHEQLNKVVQETIRRSGDA